MNVKTIIPVAVPAKGEYFDRKGVKDETWGTVWAWENHAIKPGTMVIIKGSISFGKSIDPVTGGIGEPVINQRISGGCDTKETLGKFSTTSWNNDSMGTTRHDIGTYDVLFVTTVRSADPIVLNLWYDNIGDFSDTDVCNVYDGNSYDEFGNVEAYLGNSSIILLIPGKSGYA